MYVPALIKCFAGTSAPSESVGRTLQANHAQAMIFRIPAGVSNDDNVVAGSQRFTRDALTAELSASAPFHGVSSDLALRVLHFNVDKRMRIAEQELNQVAFDSFLLVLKV